MSAIETLHIGLLEIENRSLKARVDELEKENKQLKITVEHASDDFDYALTSIKADLVNDFEAKLNAVEVKFNEADRRFNQTINELREELEELERLRNETNPS